MMTKVLVLGAGRIGSVIARDLSSEFSVTIADFNQDILNQIQNKFGLVTQQIDFTNNQQLSEILKNADLVVSAVPGFLGFQVLETIIKEGKNVVDISFFPEDAFQLNSLALAKNVTAVVDCGVAPGLSNIILGHYYKHHQAFSFKCYVGGLPQKRVPPFEYKAPFSPIDVIEEYCRPARVKEHGVIIIKEALSEIEEMNFEVLGILEAFNTDGLRTLLQTINIPDMVEKTLRYPGHAKLMKAFRDSGFFNTEPIEIDSQQVRPIDLTSKLFFKEWKLEEGEAEYTIMKIELGTAFGLVSYSIFAETDSMNIISSMAQTTGYTCTSVLRLLASNKIQEKGVIPPEYLGFDKLNYEAILKELIKKGIKISKIVRDY